MEQIGVAVIGAGPYGLSVAACLDAAGADYRLFGQAMHSWDSAMPAGMFLKSDGFASNLVTPRRGGTLADHCRARGLAYHPTATRTSRAEFVRYGRDFAARFVARHDTGDIARLTRVDTGFALTTTQGHAYRAQAVVLAVGIRHFAAMPPVLAALPPHLVSHSFGHVHVDRFAGRDVTVVGGGASAVELAAALAHAGARARLLVREDRVQFNSGPMGAPRSLWKRLRHPSSGLGPGMRSWLCCAMPGLYRHLPASRRLRFLGSHLGPRTPFEYRATVERAVEVITGVSIETAEADGNAVRLACRLADGRPRAITTDHIIAGTGYRPDCRRLPFLDPALAGAIACEEGYPVLDARFATNIPGLHVVGLAAAGSFGPLMRFVHGAGYAAPRLARALARHHGTRTAAA
jgi:thioredoxin reductase